MFLPEGDPREKTCTQQQPDGIWGGGEGVGKEGVKPFESLIPYVAE